MDWTELDAPPVLRGPRVTLRPVADGDVDALWVVFGDPGVARFLDRPAWPDRAAAEARIRVMRRGIADRRGLTWAVTLDDDVAVGTMSLFHLDQEHRRGEMGWALARSAWGRGLAFEACGLVIRFAWDVLDLHRLEADCHPENAASIGLARRLGFRHEGRLREKWWVGGEVSDAMILGVLRGEETLSR